MKIEIKNIPFWDFSGSPVLGPSTFIAIRLNSIPGQRTKILKHGKKKKNHTIYSSSKNVKYRAVKLTEEVQVLHENGQYKTQLRKIKGDLSKCIDTLRSRRQYC